jgi:hypothetical protein
MSGGYHRSVITAINSKSMQRQAAAAPLFSMESVSADQPLSF